MNKRKISLLFFLFTVFSFVSAQDEVKWKFSLQDKGNGIIEFIADATIKPNWHLYDTQIPDGGPTPTSLNFDRITGAELIGQFKAVGKQASVKYDAMFEMNIGTFDNSVRFVQALKVTDKAAFAIAGDVRAQACDDKSCTPPLPIDFSFTSAQLPASVTTAAAAVPSSASATQGANETKNEGGHLGLARQRHSIGSFGGECRFALGSGHQRASRLRHGRQHFRDVAVLGLLFRIHRRAHRFAYSLRMAYDSDDGELFSQKK